jgi:hypothetical protein
VVAVRAWGFETSGQYANVFYFAVATWLIWGQAAQHEYADISHLATRLQACLSLQRMQW